jgi:ATP-dependent DNA helicase RecQ
VAAYHAGIETQERTDIQDQFMNDEIRIIVATNAFGMGVDKPDVRFVLHYNIPKNMEAYYQEAGRAGRDGEQADCILMYDASDIVKQKFLIGTSTQDTERYRQQMENLQSLIQYCHTDACLRKTIAEYFDQQWPKNTCGSCGNCLDESETTDASQEAQMILSCIYRTQQRFGMNMIVDVLRGSKNQKILSWKLDQQSTYGLMKDRSEIYVKELLQFLIAKGYINMSHDEFPVLSLDASAKSILKGEETIVIKKTRLVNTRTKGKTTKSNLSAEVNADVYSALAALRKRIADEKGLPAFMIFGNKDLEEMAKALPRSAEELLMVKGVGERKLAMYGDAFLKAIAEAIG